MPSNPESCRVRRLQPSERAVSAPQKPSTLLRPAELGLAARRRGFSTRRGAEESRAESFGLCFLSVSQKMQCFFARPGSWATG